MRPHAGGHRIGPPAADSAGTPWTGRALRGTGFDGDTGEADRELAAVLAEQAASPSAQADSRLVRAAAAARWIVPVVALLGEAGPGPTTRADERPSGGHTAEKATDLAAVTITLPDGRRGLPVFTSVAALAVWDPAARPVPVTGARAAQAAVAEGCQALVVDLGGPSVTELRPSMVSALARAEEWRPAHADPVVAQSVSRAVRDEPDVVAQRLEEGRPAGSGVLTVVFVLRAGLGAGEVGALASRVGERLASDEGFRSRVDELVLRVERVRR